MIVNGYGIGTYMELEYKFSGIRIIENELIPVKWVLKLNLTGLGDANDQLEDREELANTAYQRMYFWLETNLSNVLAFDINDEFASYVAHNSDNIMLYCPGEPSDGLLVRLLHAKLSMVSGTALYIGAVTLRADDLPVAYVFEPSEGYELPEDATTLYTGQVLNSTPWWFRDDGFTFDFVKPDGVDADIHELFKDIYDPLNEFDESNAKPKKENDVPAEIIKWKPKKV